MAVDATSELKQKIPFRVKGKIKDLSAAAA